MKNVFSTLLLSISSLLTFNCWAVGDKAVYDTPVLSWSGLSEPKKYEKVQELIVIKNNDVADRVENKVSSSKYLETVTQDKFETIEDSLKEIFHILGFIIPIIFLSVIILRILT